jgi:hypothetical protein
MDMLATLLALGLFALTLALIPLFERLRKQPS